MSNENSVDHQVDAHFFNIVVSLSQSALVGMGKVSNPHSGEIEKNMEFAKINIDIIQMLKEKTNGNLSKKEKEIITDTLMNLQLTFADEKKKGEKSPESESTASSEESEDKTSSEVEDSETDSK